ncbi:MAG: AIR synthase related protein [Peptococcaceae bacterium]
MDKATNFRDLTLIELGGGDCLVIACDSLGGIGPKSRDKIKAPGEILGIFTARVPLLEVMAAGAQPLAVINTLSVEMNPTGAAILKGITKEVAAAGLAGDLVITGSTEENITTVQSALGVTVIGKIHKSKLRLGQSAGGDLIVCIGIPQIGEEVLTGKTADARLLLKLLAIPWIKEILPAGSKGIAYEAAQLAEGAGLRLDLLPAQTVDLKKSAGPATCLLATLDKNYLPQLIKLTDLPVHEIGYLKN